jgi:poly-gamma-glutamate synthesis protein (capsule biosynthesis protein)
VPAKACVTPDVHACALDDSHRAGEWRYALIAGPFEPRLALTLAELRAAWAAGKVGAAPETEAVMRRVLGARTAVSFDVHAELARDHFAIVGVDELGPSYTIVTVDGAHPLAREATGPLALGLCASSGHIANFDPAHLTTLVMSGTTALTGRTAERIDNAGIADTIRYLAPFFTSADLVHVSNEVTFVRDCHPATGQSSKELKFCSRDRYIDLLAALHTSIIELTGSHLFDYGTHSLVRTLDMYEHRGWIWYGGGRTQIDATAPKFVDDHGNKLAFVGCNHVNWWIKQIYTGPGGANCDYPRMTWQIHDLRRRGYTVIATVQHRELVTHRPDGDLVRDLRRLAEAGATFVEGSQAHTAHPWDVHDRAYVHYGPGNTLFAQHAANQIDATVDKLYIHAGRLLAVDHLFIRTEHGQPRVMTDLERVRFLDQMATAEASIAPPDPWTQPVLAPPTRVRPDSVVTHGKSQPLEVTMPEPFVDGTHYPLVVELAPTDGAPASDAITVTRTSKALATAAEIIAFMRAKYSVDPARVTIHGT